MARGAGELYKDKIEVSLDGRQIFYLFFGGAVIASMVFVLGVMVGQRVEARTQVDDVVATRAALDPLAALDQLDGREGSDLLFPRTLRGDGEEDATLAELDEALSRGATGPAEGTERAAAAPSPVEPPAPSPVEPPAPAPPSAARAAEPARDPAGAREQAPAAKPEPVRASDEAGETRFTLQLSSFQDRSEAESFLADLKGAGYRAHMVEAEVPGRGTWYRVRLGRYGSYGEALRAKEKFERERHMIAYVTRVP
jgi:DedD protein